jgi:undecaprenyl-diphosphatase
LAREGVAAVAPETEAPRKLNYFDATILGLVEGITEYLPISSTGHLILTNELLGLNREAPVTNRLGEPVFKVPPEEARARGEPVEPYTLKDAADAYAIVIQAGAIAAVLFLYWGRVWNAFRGSLFRLLGFIGLRLGVASENLKGWRLGQNLLLAFLPAVVFGLLLEEFIERHLFGPWPVVGALAAGAFLMLGVETWRRRRIRASASALLLEGREGPDLHELHPLKALFIGLLQCVAMWPGTSRSMMTIVGGYLVGFSPRRAAEFSFLLGLITLTAAAAYKLLKDGRNMLAVLDPLPVLLGCVVAFVSAALAVSWLVSFLSRRGLAPFAWYRLALAVVFALFLL